MKLLGRCGWKSESPGILRRDSIIMVLLFASCDNRTSDRHEAAELSTKQHHHGTKAKSHEESLPYDSEVVCRRSLSFRVLNGP